MSTRPKIATIGYESVTLDQMIEKLKRAGVKQVIDVRAVSASRRPGFSKTMLAASLAEHGISYLHLRKLGTPKAGREAARAGRVAEMRAIYEKHLEEPEAQLELVAARDEAQKKLSALLCYENDAGHCHRAIIAERLRDEHGFEVIDL
jgi:uncharacterized protein (DUF488 family)